jgi:DNA (cytosine-5)-methyltransferase 1
VAKRPSFLLLENVKALTSEKFLPLLQKWCAELSSYGYINHCAVLNTKDYGVPQNRERVFVFSVRRDIPGASDYRFPRPFPLKRKLRNILEEDVDEKYYLKDETVEKFLRKTVENKEKGLGFAFPPPNLDGVSYTLKCQGYESVADPRFIDLLGYSRSNKGKGEVNNYHPIETANTLTTSSGSGGNTDQFVRVGGIRTRPTGGGKELRLELHSDPDTTGTLTTVEQFNNLLVINEADGNAPQRRDSGDSSDLKSGIL